MKNPKISVIICSIEALKFARICENYKRLLAAVHHEIIGIHDAISLGEGYNRGILQSTGDIIIFSHDDILILDDHFANKIMDRLSNYGLLGFAGASRITNGKWIDAANQYLHGVIAHALPKSESLTLNVYGANEWPVVSDIKVIDGLCMIATREVANRIGFDAATFDGFHLYDLDFSFSCYLAGFRIGVCCDIPIIHESGGNFDEKYNDYSQRFIKKHQMHLDPLECARPKTTPFCSATSISDSETLLHEWNKKSFAFATNKLLSSAAFASNNTVQHSLSNSFEQTTEFVDSSNLNSISEKYQRWLSLRNFIETDIAFLNDQQPTPDHSKALFHLIIRPSLGHEALLADTLDSLALQIHEGWHLDIISTQLCPINLEGVTNIGWHKIAENSQSKETADFLARASQYNWLIELPAGARMDILYLWRLAKEISSAPELSAFFVDDDCCDISGTRHSPRFKPGTNPAYLQSTDLAGPLCVRKDIWVASGGASENNNSPWFGQLLRISDKVGWRQIKHIPDVLITYLNKFPADIASCQCALIEYLKESGTTAEITPATPQSWNVSYSFDASPQITIAIISQGQLELISRCLESLIRITRYPEYEIIIVTNELSDDLELDDWLRNIHKKYPSQKIGCLRSTDNGNHASRCNLAVASSDNDLVLLLREEVVIVQESWLEELVRTCQHGDVVAVAPLLHSPGDADILITGSILGLLGTHTSPLGGNALLNDSGYLDYLKIARDASALSSHCLLIDKTSYLSVEGMDELELGDHLADTDLCLKLRQCNGRLIVQSRASVVFGGETSQYDVMLKLKSTIAKKESTLNLRKRWGKMAAIDPYWNPNLSLIELNPTPEIEFLAQWQYLPSDKPRILAHPISNGQGDFRITSPLTAIRKAGLAMECVWRQKLGTKPRYNTTAEIARMAPNSVIVQNYIHNLSLEALEEWNSSHCRPFVVYALDDLINDMDKTNPFRKHIPPNSRARLKYALARCDRMVVSTEFLAESYQHFIKDIRVVPNRLEQDIWSSLSGLKRTGKRPRIGWAGGSTHQGDLILLKEIIEQTRDEADWIFFGMCPDEIRPLLAEYHELVYFTEYPTYLAALNLDIAVAPLAMTPFNQGKSNLRLLEYGALGIPVVCTDIDPYRNSPACRVTNTANAWTNALRERIYDADAREREGNAMRRWVLDNYLLENHLEEWLEAHLPG